VGWGAVVVGVLGVVCGSGLGWFNVCFDGGESSSPGLRRSPSPLPGVLSLDFSRDPGPGPLGLRHHAV